MANDDRHLEAKRELGRQPVVYRAEDWMADKGVLHCSMSAFKGRCRAAG